MWGALWGWLNSSSPVCEIFSRGSYSSFKVNGGRVGITGEGNIGELTFDVYGNREKLITTTLTVIPRTKLDGDPRLEFPDSRTNHTLISDWAIVLTDYETIVYSDNDPVAFIFKNKDEFAFMILENVVGSLLRLKYFQERNIVSKIQEKGYSPELVQRAKTESPAAFAKFIENLDDAESALEVLSLERILKIGQRELTFPHTEVQKCIRISTGIHHFGGLLGGDAGWKAEIKEDFGTCKVTLHREGETTRGTFTTKKHYKAYAEGLPSMIQKKLLNEWYVSESIKNGKKYGYYLCPKLEEFLSLEADLDFPVDELDSSVVTHQYFYEIELEKFMNKQEQTIQDALLRPGWSEKKLQLLATDLKYAEEWIDQGITFQQLEDMEEKKFCHMLQKHWTVKDALKFASLHEILGCTPPAQGVRHEEEVEGRSRCRIL